MTKEDFKALEDKVEALKTAADQAANALADNPDDAGLQQKADAAESALTDAEAELGAAVVDDEEPEGESSEDDEHIDFDEELKKLNGNPPQPAAPSSKDELTKAQTALFHNAKRLQDLGGDPTAVLEGFKKPEPVVPPTPNPATPPTPVATDTFTREDMVELEFGKIAKSEAERKVYMHHYKNSIVKTGNLATDMENAMLIANKGKILRSFGEIRRAGFSVPRPPSNSGKPPLTPRVVKVSASEATVLRRRGFKEQADGSWKGKKYTLAIDPKTRTLVQTPNK